MWGDYVVSSLRFQQKRQLPLMVTVEDLVAVEGGQEHIESAALGV